MDKNTEIKFVGQPIFKQILNLVGAVNIQSLINRYQSDRYYKAFKTRTHLITMLLGIFSRCDSMTEICEGLRAFDGKLNHLGLDKAPAKSTACDGLRIFLLYARFLLCVYHQLMLNPRHFYLLLLSRSRSLIMLNIFPL